MFASFTNSFNRKVALLEHDVVKLYSNMKLMEHNNESALKREAKFQNVWNLFNGRLKEVISML